MADPTTVPPPKDDSPEGFAATALPNTAASLRLAEDLKTEGNDHFRAARWNEALVAYRSGLSNLPRRIEAVDYGPADGDNSSEEAPAEEVIKEGEHLVSTDDPLSPSLLDDLDKSCAKLRAVLNANIGACYVKLVNMISLDAALWRLISCSVRATINKLSTLVHKV
ncbi:hypothetical protein DXG03_006079 [Asterophora parasitica]|uniref:Uncharacterized protein n=1 Tax=Asterophora parasitica TaxID=117018 RepID=A0A9P7GF20_9AGAR|nr:hypothetical protein DXG03_006079 [Asterophora parasitica]